MMTSRPSVISVVPTLAILGLGFVLGMLLFQVVPDLFGPNSSFRFINALTAGAGLGLLMVGVGEGTGTALRLAWFIMQGRDIGDRTSDVRNLVVCCLYTPCGAALTYLGIIRFLRLGLQ